MKKTIRVKCCKCDHVWESPIVIVGYVKQFYLTTVDNVMKCDYDSGDKVVEYIACPKCHSVVGASKEKK